jgi:cytochrome b561
LRWHAEPLPFWSRAQRVLHWTIAVLVLLAAVIAPIMVALPFRQLLLKFLLFQLHKTVGITVLLLALGQMALHRRRGRPAWDPGVTPWQRRAARGMHIALFALLTATPCLGYLTAATAPASIPTLFLGVIPVPNIVGPDAAAFASLRWIHLGLAVTLTVLAAGHAAMAVIHHRLGHGTLAAMWRGRAVPTA